MHVLDDLICHIRYRAPHAFTVCNSACSCASRRCCAGTQAVEPDVAVADQV